MSRLLTEVPEEDDEYWEDFVDYCSECDERIYDYEGYVITAFGILCNECADEVE